MTIKKFDSYEKIIAFGPKILLPRGAYVATIKHVLIKENSRGDYLNLSYDIAEGPYKGYFMNNYESQDSEDKKWKGLIFINIPTDDGSKRDYYNKKNFKTFTTAIEKSNPGYLFDWDEQKFVGKTVGIIINHKEIEFSNGNTAIVPNVSRICSADQVRTGNCVIPDDILLPKKPKEKEQADMPFVSLDEQEELPF